MKNILTLLLTLPLFSACGIVGTATSIAGKVITVPIEVLTYAETEEGDDIDYAELSEQVGR